MWLMFAGVVAVYKVIKEGGERFVDDGEEHSMIFSKIQARNGMAQQRRGCLWRFRAFTCLQERQ
jgi:hypothetical protein